MRFWAALALYLGISTAFGYGEMGCTIRFSAGSADDVPAESGFLPPGGATQNSGVMFSVSGTNVGAVSWNGSSTYKMNVGNCYLAFKEALAVNSRVPVRAQYISAEMTQHHISTTPLCSEAGLSKLTALDMYIPPFPSGRWAPCH